MSAFKNIGLIVCRHTEKVFNLNAVSSANGYVIRKVLLPEDVSERAIRQIYPAAEIVKDKYALLQDESIDLIVFTEPVNNYSSLIGEILQKGIPIRIASEV